MKYFSTFSGIGGMELGMIRAYENNTRPKSKKRIKADARRGVVTVHAKRLAVPVCVGYSEIDKHAIKIYQKHFPTHKNYGDITQIDEKKLPDFDALVGGFPCQSFSIAGKRKGFDDTRGTMFFEICRILKQKQPRLVLFENVKGLLSHDQGRTFTTIIASLDELGYDLQWQLLNSKNFGVPQNRERVFIVGHLRGSRRPEVFPFIDDAGISDIKNEAEGGRTQAEVSHTLRGPNVKADQLFIREVGTLRTHKDGQGFRKTKSGLVPTIPARAREDGSGQPIVYIPEATRGGTPKRGSATA